jgi:hydroxylamine reductase
MGMFCYQCEQTLRTANTTGCNALGICGKTEATANLQDLLIYALTGLGVWRNLAKELGSDTTSADYFIIESLFTTLTNVNFDAKKIEQLIYKTVQIRDELKQQYLAACDVQKMQAKNPLVAATSFTPLSTRDGLLTQATEICFDIRNLTLGERSCSLYISCAHVKI